MLKGHTIYVTLNKKILIDTHLVQLPEIDKIVDLFKKFTFGKCLKHKKVF